MRTLFCTEDSSFWAACLGGPSLCPVSPYFKFKPVLANPLKAPCSLLGFRQLKDGRNGKGALSKLQPWAYSSRLIPHSTSLPPERHIGPPAHTPSTNFAQVGSISGQPALCLCPQKDLVFLVPSFITSGPTPPGSWQNGSFPMETGTASWFVCYLIIPLFLHQETLVWFYCVPGFVLGT